MHTYTHSKILDSVNLIVNLQQSGDPNCNLHIAGRLRILQHFLLIFIEFHIVHCISEKDTLCRCR